MTSCQSSIVWTFLCIMVDVSKTVFLSTEELPFSPIASSASMTVPFRAVKESVAYSMLAYHFLYIIDQLGFSRLLESSLARPASFGGHH